MKNGDIIYVVYSSLGTTKVYEAQMLTDFVKSEKMPWRNTWICRYKPLKIFTLETGWNIALQPIYTVHKENCYADKADAWAAVQLGYLKQLKSLKSSCLDAENCLLTAQKNLEFLQQRLKETEELKWSAESTGFTTRSEDKEKYVSIFTGQEK